MAKQSLKKHFVALSRDGLIYGLGNAVPGLIFFFAAPILTRKFSPSEYGIIALIASSISFLNLFLIFGMDTATTLTYYGRKKDQRGLVSGVFLFLTLWGVLLIGVAMLFSEKISFSLFDTGVYRFALIAALSSAFFNLLVNFSKTVFRLDFKAKTFSLITEVNAILSMGIALLFVLQGKGILGYCLGGAIGVFLSLLWAFWLIKDKLTFKIPWAQVKETVWHGAAVVPVSLAYFVFNLSNRFFIGKFRSFDELGLFAIAVNINSILAFFSVALGRAWIPYVLKMYHESKATFNDFMPRLFTYSLILFFTLAACLAIFRQELLIVLSTSNYYEAGNIIGILAIATCFSASTQLSSIGMYAAKKTKKIAFWAGVSAVINILLNFYLIPRYGLEGASWATA